MDSVRKQRAPWLHGVALWILIMSCESMNGSVRELYLRPWLGAVTAKQISFAIAAALILCIAYVFTPWLRVNTARVQLQIGALWLLLTFAFEIILARISHLSLNEFLAEYDVTRGGWMLFGLLILLFAPLFGAWLHSVRNS